MLNEIATVRLRDLEIFTEVARAKSIREVARRLGSTSGQVSKTIQGLEKKLGTKLFRRSVAGVLPTNHGTELLTLAQNLLDAGEKIEGLVAGKRQKLEKTIAIAGTSFFNTHFVAPTVCKVFQNFPKHSFRFLDLAPDQIMAVGIRGGFEAAVHYGALSWPSTWTSKSLGKSKWSLCARIGHPLAKRPTLRQVLEYPFVVPTYWTSEGLVRGNDQFPLSLSKRKVGFETATADAVIPILTNTDQVAFLPDILTRTFVDQGHFRNVHLDEIPLVQKEVFISAKSDAVPSSIFLGLASEMANRLKS